MAGSQVLAGQSSAVNNGQLVPWYRGGNYYPRPLRANGPGGISGAGSANPAFPPQTSGPGYSKGASASGSTQAGQDAAASPFSPFKSPVPWLIAFLVISFLLMRYVHHGY